MDENRFATHSLHDARVLRVLSAALAAVDPGVAVRRYLTEHPLDRSRKVYGLAIGKAAVPMLDALAGLYPLADGLAVTKHAARGTEGRFAVMEGGHPIPDARSLAAGERVLEFAARAGDLLVCLISGGGSALVSAPHAGIDLEDLQTLTTLLLSSGAPIDEVNTLRRHLDRVKGGGLLRVATTTDVLSLIISDVVGNPLPAIASGPTAPDPSTRGDAIAILKKYGLENRVSTAILKALESAPETVKADDPARVRNVIIADNSLAAHAAQQQAEAEGFQAEVLTIEMQGEAREVGRELAQRLRDAAAGRRRPFCMVVGGETTVTLRGSGRGGRNQELALAAVSELDGVEHVLLVSLATDGDDGPTDAAGAVVTGESAHRAESLGLAAPDHLSRNDAYPFFEALGDLLKPGYSGTNVNDLIFLLAL
jgi:hydroxypyruvate reductase